MSELVLLEIWYAAPGYSAKTILEGMLEFREDGDADAVRRIGVLDSEVPDWRDRLCVFAYPDDHRITFSNALCVKLPPGVALHLSLLLDLKYAPM